MTTFNLFDVPAGITPAIHLPYAYFQDVGINITVKDLHIAAECLWKSLKKVTNHKWDNTHYLINDIAGRPALTILFMETNIGFWLVHNGCSLPDVSYDLWSNKREKAVKLIDIYVDKASQGLTLCGKCHRWIGEYHTYSFTGAVCNKCYDPKIHTLPDTRGD